MIAKHSYSAARSLLTITATVLFSLLALEWSGVIIRKPGMEWVLPVCSVAFALAVLYANVLVILNAKKGNI